MPHPRRSRKRDANSRKRDEHPPLDVDRILQGSKRTEYRRGIEYSVQPMSARNAVKDYVCPGCGGTVAAATAHVVVWQNDSIFSERALEDRRHWHTGCWRAS